MACANPLSEQQLVDIERTIQQSERAVRNAPKTETGRPHAERAAKEVRELGELKTELAQMNRSTKNGWHETNAVKQDVRQFAENKVGEVRRAEQQNPATKWQDSNPVFIDRTGEARPNEIVNSDENTIPGFHSGVWTHGNIFKNDNDPVDTHVHYLGNGGIVISTFDHRTGAVNRFNVVTGEDAGSKKGPDERSKWPEDAA